MVLHNFINCRFFFTVLIERHQMTELHIVRLTERQNDSGKMTQDFYFAFTYDLIEYITTLQ